MFIERRSAVHRAVFTQTTHYIKEFDLQRIQEGSVIYPARAKNPQEVQFRHLNGISTRLGSRGSCIMKLINEHTK